MVDVVAVVNDGDIAVVVVAVVIMVVVVVVVMAVIVNDCNVSTIHRSSPYYAILWWLMRPSDVLVTKIRILFVWTF